ncbi:putative nuclease HARBI1 [Penaeus vannamei]|uniref:putative nuclease HARBI1 n=1 Tax=Penaeus vannamei TaxID=6689 RepID=UPI00387F3B0C
MATGNFQLSMADCSDVSQSSVSRCVLAIAASIAELAPRHIKFPEPNNEETIMNQYSVIAGMLGVIGCVDGPHIPIRSHGGVDAELYRCRKGFFSLNVMGVCDTSLELVNDIANRPGSAHDARIFNESKLCEKLRSGIYKGFLLGDSGYPCRSYILTSFGNPSTDKQRRPVKAHFEALFEICPEILIGLKFGIWVFHIKNIYTTFEQNPKL